jgi:hypothetical protein
MLTPVKQVSVPFTSDGTSTLLALVLSAPPIGLDLTAKLPVGVLSPYVSGGTMPAQATAALVGETVTLSFAAPLPQYDSNGVLIMYTVTFLVQFPG